MGLLLMQYEYQRAKQKCNVLQLEGIRLNNKHELYTKRIGKIQELFGKKKTQTESKYTRINSQLSSTINQAAAMGGSALTSGSIFSSLGISTKYLTSCASFSTSLNSALGEVTAEDDNKLATKQQSVISAAASQLITQLQSIVEAIKEAELAELEELEEAQTEPIAEKDSEMQSKIATNETLTSLAEQRAEAAKSKLPDVAKNSVAHYGLS